MADVSLGHAPQSVDSIQANYMAHVQRRRLYGGLTLLIFVVLMVAGFNIADDRNAGGFWEGLHQIGDYPADVLSEAWEKRADLPGLIVKYFPALVETINIAAVSTLIGAFGGLLLSLLGTRGLAKWPSLIPLFRRLSDIMRAVPEIVIALVLIFVLGGGPVPAMIAIAIHTAGALGKLFSEVSENTDLKPVEGLAVCRRELDPTDAGWVIIPQVAPNYPQLCAAAVRDQHPRFGHPGLCWAGGIWDMSCAIPCPGGRGGSMRRRRSLCCCSARLCSSISSQAATATN